MMGVCGRGWEGSTICGIETTGCGGGGGGWGGCTGAAEGPKLAARAPIGKKVGSVRQLSNQIFETDFRAVLTLISEATVIIHY